MPGVRRNSRTVPARLDQLEFGTPFPMWRGVRTTDQTIAAGDDSPILWDDWENSNSDIFTEVTVGSPATVQSVEAHLRGLYVVQASYEWETFPSPANYWITIHDGYFSPSVLYQTIEGFASLGNEISLVIVRGYAQFREVVVGTPVATFQVDAGNGDVADHDVDAGTARVEIYYLGGLGVDTEQYV